jgi:sulfur carrier protein
MHCLVLENREHRLGAIEQRPSGLFDAAIRNRVDDAAVGFGGEGADLVARRPAFRLARSARPGFSRIDAAGEEQLQIRIDARQAEPFLHERVEAEGRQMAFVEHDGMTQIDRPAVIRIVDQEIEQRARTGAIAAVPLQGGAAVESHHYSLYVRIERSLHITLNGDPVEIPGPLTVIELLSRFEIDPRRVAVEHNLNVLKRAAYTDTVVRDGDRVEIVNFVGGG